MTFDDDPEQQFCGGLATTDDPNLIIEAERFDPMPNLSPKSFCVLDFDPKGLSDAEPAGGGEPVLLPPAPASSYNIECAKYATEAVGVAPGASDSAVRNDVFASIVLAISAAFQFG